VESGAQPNNTNATKGTVWSDAVRKELISSGGLKKAARKLVSLACGGDVRALKEIGDRMDGKAIQAIEGRLDTTITIVQVTFGSKPMRPCINGSTDTKQLDSPWLPAQCLGLY